MPTYRFTDTSDLMMELDSFIDDLIKEAVDEVVEEKDSIIEELEDEINELRDGLSDLEDLNNELSEQVSFYKEHLNE